MAANVIKGLTVEIGGDTTKLGKALEDVNKQSSSLSKELGEVNRLLKVDPKNTELLAQKQKILADAISNTGKKLDTLKEAERQVQAQFERGEVSEEQVRALKREIIATEKKLNGYERAAKETAGAVEDVGEEAKEAAEKNDDFADSLSNGVKVGLAAVAAGVTAAVAAIASSVEATQEYRREMGKLDTAFTQNGHSSAAATKTYEALQGILGETDQAVEAANHLAKLTKNEADLATWTDICTGVYAQFGASLPIEGLTEAANETAKTGALTGSLADALNWAGVNEDKFQESLDKCKTEQERQALITETLIDLYGETADAYRENNAEVIRSNEATEKLNKAWARVGAKAAPTVNTFREGIADLADSFADLLEGADLDEFNLSVKKGFRELSNNVLPKLIDGLEWCAENFELLQSIAIGATAAFVSYKAAVIAAEIAHSGLLATIKATTVAQTALNLVQKATPWGLAAAAIAGVVVAVTAYSESTKNATEKVRVLTVEEEGLILSAQDAASAFRDQKKAFEENAGGITSQMGHVKNLSDELQTLVDKNGKVKETDKARVDFILGELNDALGTEYKMVDGVVQKYGDLKKNIDAVIQSKTTNALLEAGNEAYVTALQNENAAWEAVVLTEKDYIAQQDVVKQKEAELAAAREASNAAAQTGNRAAMVSAGNRLIAAQSNLDKEKGILTEKKTAYDQASVDYGTYSNTIANYEAAQAAALQGNYDTAMQLLQGKSQAYSTHAATVDTETAKVLDTLYREAVDAGIAAGNTKKNFENGVAGYTQEMVDEADQGYADALAAYETAYNDAHGVGEDIGGGLSDGMESKRTTVLGKIRSIVSAIIGAAKEEADINSPSRVMRDEVGKQLALGVAEGIKKNTSKAEKEAEELAAAVLSNAQKRLDQYKTYNEMTLADEVAFWDGVRSQVKEGTDARLQADQKYLTAKKSLDQQLADAEKEYQNALDETQKKVEDRTSSILSSMGLFDKFTRESVKGSDLTKNLESQVRAMGQWDMTLASLEHKIGDTALFKELQSMGVDALDEAWAIDRMNAADLEQYVYLYEKRAKLARELAEDELGDEVAQEQAEAYQTYIDTCDQLGVAVNTANDAMVAHTQTALAQLQVVAAQAQAIFATMGAMGINPAMLVTGGAASTSAGGGGNNSAVLSKLDAIYARLGQLKVYLNGDALVGELVDDMDAALAGRQLLHERGV
jgi:phage-related protein